MYPYPCAQAVKPKLYAMPFIIARARDINIIAYAAAFRGSFNIIQCMIYQFPSQYFSNKPALFWSHHSDQALEARRRTLDHQIPKK